MMQPKSDRSFLDRPAWLRSLARSALARFGLSGARCELIKDHRNASFKVESRSVRFLLRIHTSRWHSRARVESELLWLEALRGDHVLDVPAPVRSKEGELLVEISSACPDVALASLITWLPGSHVVSPLRSGDQLVQIGLILAVVHDHGRRWPNPAGFDRPSLTSESLYGAAGTLGGIVQRAWERLEPGVRGGLAHARERLRQAESTLGTDASHYGLIHGDPSYGNLLFLPDRALVIDFDDCGWGHFVYDVAVVLSGAWRSDSFPQDCERIVEGYRRVRELGALELSFLPVFMAARAGTLLLHAAAESADDGRIASEWRRIRFFLGL